jgi:hypothetical protein
MLDARAHAATGDTAGARPIYERALAADRDNPVEIALDWAASELAGGDPAIAITALEKTAAAAKTGPLAARHKVALATARHGRRRRARPATAPRSSCCARRPPPTTAYRRAATSRSRRSPSATDRGATALR